MLSVRLFGPPRDRNRSRGQSRKGKPPKTPLPSRVRPDTMGRTVTPPTEATREDALKKQSHVQQHFVPRFLLETWASGDDGKLTAMSWAGKKLLSERYKAKSVAKEKHIYSVDPHGDSPNTYIETDFMTKHVDEPAALVHKKLLVGGLHALTPEDRGLWMQFMVALTVRGPSMMRHVRETGRKVFTEVLLEDPGEFAPLLDPNGDADLVGWMNRQHPNSIPNFGVHALPAVVQSDVMNRHYVGKTWHFRSLERAKRDLVIGDNPVVLFGAHGLMTASILPVSPKHIFMVANEENSRALRQTSEDELVVILNKHQAQRADRYVHATDSSHVQLVRKYLRLDGKSLYDDMKRAVGSQGEVEAPAS